MDSSISSTNSSTNRPTADFATADLLASGLLALQQQQYQEAIGILEAFCHDCAAKAQLNSRDYLRAQMHLVTTYSQQGQPERALALCHNLAQSSNAQVRIWAEQKLKAIDSDQTDPQRPSPLLLGKLKRWFLAAG
ncbi:MAG: hypothetical protein ACKO7W_01015 [Elainella sp.]